jgi:hypothetical protein
MCPDGRVGQVDGDAGEADGGDGLAGHPVVDQDAAAGRPGEALELLRKKENQAQQLGLWLRPDVCNLIHINLKIFEKKIVPLSLVYRWLDNTQIYEKSILRESRNMVKWRILHWWG